MDDPLPLPAPLPQTRVGSRAHGEHPPPTARPTSSANAEAAASAARIDALRSLENLPPLSTPVRPKTTRNHTQHTSQTKQANHAASSSDGEDQDDELINTRPSRSTSSASRANRLSLTLPIAPPTASPSRPIPASATVASFPPTPSDTSALASPADPTDIITAIAAQERRVLELREELSHAKGTLSRLKRQYQMYEVHREQAEARRPGSSRPYSTRPDGALAATELAAVSRSADDVPDASGSAATRRSTDLDRRRALLLNQQQAGAQPKRRVFTGRHTRALSLLSPTETSSPGGFGVHEDDDVDEDVLRSPASPQSTTSSQGRVDSQFYRNLGRYAPKTAAHLSKRASWTPQSVHQAGLKQVAGDLGTALWTFVEDIRQATVGDEPIHGQGHNGSVMRSLDANVLGSPGDDQQNTIRASSNHASRPGLASAFDGEARYADLDKDAASKAGEAGKSKKGKRFSWTPLTVDSMDDSDWSNWDSPTVKSPRWSGSTVGDMTPAIPEQTDENDISVPLSPSPNKGGDIVWPTALKSLTPGNIKRTATDLMKEWEKSLATPAEGGLSSGNVANIANVTNATHM